MRGNAEADAADEVLDETVRLCRDLCLSRRLFTLGDGFVPGSVLISHGSYDNIYAYR